MRPQSEMNSLLHSIRRQIIKTHRKALARSLFTRFNGVVQHGAFAGVKFDGKANVSDASQGLKMLGLYEEPVIERLVSYTDVDTFVDVGAGDGYFPVGLLAKSHYKQAVCFEATARGREAIAKNADLNGVANRIRVHGRAENDFARQLAALDLDWAKTVLLIDIEGAEFHILTPEVLSLTRGARYIIELHNFVESAEERLANLVRAFSASWRVEIIEDKARDWHGFAELREWHDLDRAVLVSEGRKILGEWLIAEPK